MISRIDDFLEELIGRSDDPDTTGSWEVVLDEMYKEEEIDFLRRHPRKKAEDRPFSEIVMVRKLLTKTIREVADYREQAIKSDSGIAEILLKRQKGDIEQDEFEKLIDDELEVCTEKGLTFGTLPSPLFFAP